MPKPPKTSP